MSEDEEDGESDGVVGDAGQEYEPREGRRDEEWKSVAECVMGHGGRTYDNV